MIVPIVASLLGEDINGCEHHIDNVKMLHEAAI